MTVSWGALGVIWSRPLAVVVVRPQRYTCDRMYFGEVLAASGTAEYRLTKNAGRR